MKSPLPTTGIAGLTVPEITAEIRAAITKGTYRTGDLLSVGRIAAEVGIAPYRLDSVRLAARALEGEGLAVLIQGNDHVRIAGGSRARASAPDERIAGWMRELIRAGVYPHGSRLPARQGLALSLVSTSTHVTAALRRLHAEGVIVVDGRTSPTVIPSPENAQPPAVGSLLDQIAKMEIPPVELSYFDIQQMCSRVRTWWVRRTVPHPDAHLAAFRGLVGSAARLLPFAARRHPDSTDAITTLRRTAVTATSPRPADPFEDIWRTACLGAAVREALWLVRGPA